MSQGIGSLGSIGSVGGLQPLRLDDMPYEAAHKTEGKPFGEFLTEALGDVNRLQQVAGEKVQSFATGGNLDVHEVMIAMEQAGTALALTTQVRNKVVDAYQELMHIQM